MSVRCGRSVPTNHSVTRGLALCQGLSRWEGRENLPTDNLLWEPLTFWRRGPFSDTRPSHQSFTRRRIRLRIQHRPSLGAARQLAPLAQPSLDCVPSRMDTLARLARPFIPPAMGARNLFRRSYVVPSPPLPVFALGLAEYRVLLTCWMQLLRETTPRSSPFQAGYKEQPPQIALF